MVEAAVETRRGTIAYWEVGDGSPVVLVHGFPDHAIGMLPLAEALAAAGHRCLCPALPGYSPSSAPADEDYTVGEVAEDLVEFQEQLDLGRSGLVGHDWGACLGYEIASRWPDAVTHLVALAAPHSAGFVHRRTIFAEQRTAWYALLLAYSPGAAIDRRWLTALAQDWSPGLYRSDWDRICDLLMRDGVLDAVRAYYRADLEAALDPVVVRVPTTIIYGGQDACIHPLSYENLDPWFSAGLDRHLIPEVGHWPHLENEAAVGELIAAALTTRTSA